MGRTSRRWEQTRWDRLRARLPARPTHRRRLLPLVLLLPVLVLLTADTAQRPVPVVGVPAYFYPTPGSQHWTQLLTAAGGAIVIVNPADGPGATVDRVYQSVVSQLRDKGATVYGYVDSAYGNRDSATILADARRFRAWYQVGGIFLDQTAPTAAHLGYYQGLISTLHADGLEVAMNPGQPQIDRRYMDLVEHVVLFEGSYRSYLSARFASWVGDYSPSKVWHLVYNVPDTRAMARVLHLATGRNVGVVFVTNGVLPNPWNALPPYWDAERQSTVSEPAHA